MKNEKKNSDSISLAFKLWLCQCLHMLVEASGLRDSLCKKKKKPEENEDPG